MPTIQDLVRQFYNSQTAVVLKKTGETKALMGKIENPLFAADGSGEIVGFTLNDGLPAVGGANLAVTMHISEVISITKYDPSAVQYGKL